MPARIGENLVFTNFIITDLKKPLIEWASNCFQIVLRKIIADKEDAVYKIHALIFEHCKFPMMAK